MLHSVLKAFKPDIYNRERNPWGMETIKIEEANLLQGKNLLFKTYFK